MGDFIMVKRVLNLADGSVELALSLDLNEFGDGDKAAIIKEAFTRAEKAVWDAAGSYMSNHPVLMAEAKKQPDKTVSTLTFKASRITKDIIKGDEIYKVWGGKFERFGVRMYPEHLAETPFAAALSDKTEIKFTRDWIATVEVENGKAVRVVTLVAKS